MEDAADWGGQTRSGRCWSSREYPALRERGADEDGGRLFGSLGLSPASPARSRVKRTTTETIMLRTPDT